MGIEERLLEAANKLEGHTHPCRCEICSDTVAAVLPVVEAEVEKARDHPLEVFCAYCSKCRGPLHSVRRVFCPACDREGKSDD